MEAKKARRQKKKMKEYGAEELIVLLKKTIQLPKEFVNDYRDNIFACFHKDSVWWDLLKRLEGEIDLVLKNQKAKKIKEQEEEWCSECDNHILCCTCGH